jgi:ubiquinone/menaquinone biosynthesis C-methylase UbiE
MRTVIAAVVLAACAHATPPPLAPTPPTPTPTPTVAPAPAPPTEAELIEKSHAILLAFDRVEVATIEPAIAPSFVQFEGGKPRTRADVLDMLSKKTKGEPMFAKRTWENEKVVVHADDAVFVGKATETQGGNDSHGGGYVYVGWYVLQWVRSGTDWKLALWTWQKHAESRDFWNDIFRTGRGFNHEPNRLLVETVQGKKPGKALDVACGQGRNALYLAAQGWKTTCVDIADEGLRLARDQAQKRKLALETIESDVDKWDFGTDRWDLVTLIYAGSDDKRIAKIQPSLKKGGLFVVEFFAHVPGEDGGFEPGQLAKLFADGYDILRDDVVDDVPDWAQDHAKLVRFVARKR